MSDIKAIAYYLPQFHPTKENDLYWGKGFTEWVNVAKAKPLFRGHNQPHIPADLGFYDLRLPETREQQAEYAKRAGISAFCYWHYWFGNGIRALSSPLEEVLRLGKPNFPFCLGWANHSWLQKSWSGEKGAFSLSKSKLIFEQKYPGINDYENHFKTMLPAFKDPRYFQIDGKLLFVIFNPLGIPNMAEFIACWQALAQKEGIPNFYFVGHCYDKNVLGDIKKLGLDAINYSMHKDIMSINEIKNAFFRKWMKRINNRIHLKPYVIDYKKAVEKMDTDLWDEESIFPTIIPNWDHTPRSGNFGSVFQNCTPDLFKEHVKKIVSHIQAKKTENKVVFVKSWNEWGEGNYMEPDLEYGTSRIDALREILDEQ